MSDELLLTPSAVRILNHVSRCDPAAELEIVAGQLVNACIAEESLAGGLLHGLGLKPEALPCQSSENPSMSVAETAEGVAVARLMQTFPECLSRIVAEARRIARHDLRDGGLTSEHLLAATLRFDTSVCRQLQQLGVTSEAVMSAAGEAELAVESIPVSFTLEGIQDSGNEDSDSGATVSEPAPVPGGTGRVLDACLNRAREGLRVLEDYARFVLDDESLVRVLKDQRHRLARSEQSLSELSREMRSSDRAAADRDVAADVGTEVSGSQEQIRRQMPDIVHANARRVQESLRSLEEFGKLVSAVFAAEMKQLRYQAYAVHQQMLVASSVAVPMSSRRQERLRSAYVCVLLTESGCHHPWKDVVEACLEGGADMIQLREKQLDDRELLSRATWLAEVCRLAGVLSIVNDRVDIAQLSGVDGVHLGQEDCGVPEARRLLGAERLIGLSTHSTDDIMTPHALAADYLGVGPVFPSVTKEFKCLAGLQLVSGAQSVTGPWFAIGGIGPDNLRDVADAGARRVAVSSSVISAERPGQIVQLIREQLTIHRKNPDC